MVLDCRGVEFTAAGDAAVAAFDHVIDGYLGLAADTGERLKAVFAADPEMPMAHVLNGYFFMLMASAPLKERAVKVAAAAAGEAAKAGSARERWHAAALEAWTRGAHGAAIGHWEAILRAEPTDVLALRLTHHGYFYKGDSQNVRDTVARCLHAWDADVPGYGFVMGMRAFGLEETHAYEPAIEAGEMAVAINPDDPWAIHAVAHVYEMTDKPEQGLDWLRDNEPGWTGCNNFRYHVWWHRALMRLDRGEYDEALALYDNDLWDPASDEYLDLVNDAALLQRFELHGVDVGERWQVVADKCKARTNDQILAFVDAHFALALAAAEASETRELLDNMRAHTDDRVADNAAITAKIGLPLAEALVAYRRADFAAAVERLEPIRYAVHGIGGSHAQRDLFAMILLDAAIRAERPELARSLAAERLCRMPENAWAHEAYERAFA